MDKRKHRRSRRFLSALMVLAMLVSLLPAGAYATAPAADSTTNEIVEQTPTNEPGSEEPGNEPDGDVTEPSEGTEPTEPNEPEEPTEPEQPVVEPEPEEPVVEDYTITPDMTQEAVDAAVASATGEITVEPGDYGIEGEKNHIKLTLKKGNQTVRLADGGQYERLMIVVLSEGNTIIGAGATIDGNVDTVYNQSPAIYVPYGSVTLQGELSIKNHDYGVILGYTNGTESENSTFTLASKAVLNITGCKSVDGNSSYDGGIVCKGEDYFSYVDTQGDGTRGSGITTKGKSNIKIIVSENAHLNVTENSGAGIFAITVKFTLDIKPGAIVDLNNNGQGLCMNTDFVSELLVSVDNATLNIKNNRSNGVSGQSRPYLLDIKNGSIVNIDNNGAIGIKDFFVKVNGQSELSVSGNRSHGMTNVGIDIVDSTAIFNDNAYLGLNVTKYNEGADKTTISNSNVTANNNGGPGIRFYIGNGVTDITNSKITTNNNGEGSDIYGYPVKPGDSGYWAGIVGKGKVTLTNSVVYSDSAGGYSLYNDSSAPANLYISGTDVVVFDATESMSDMDVFDDWNTAKSNTGRTHVMGGSLQAESQQITEGENVIKSLNQKVPEVGSTTDKAEVQYGAPINDNNTALTRFDLHQSMNTVVNGDETNAFKVWDPNSSDEMITTYDYTFRYNEQGEDLDTDASGNAYVWTPVTMLHYDATEGTIAADNLGTAESGDKAITSDRGDGSELGNEAVGGDYIDATDYTICGNSLALSEGTLPVAEKEGAEFGGWYYAIGEENIAKAAELAEAKNYTALYQLLTTEGKGALFTADTLTSADGADVDNITLYAVWTVLTITPADIIVYTGGTGYESIIVGDETVTDTNNKNGLPEPGYYLTLPDWLNDELQIDPDEDDTGNEAANLTGDVTFTYSGKDSTGADVTRSWPIKLYSEVNGGTSYETTVAGVERARYIYQIEPSEGNYVRAQFTLLDGEGNPTGEPVNSDDFMLDMSEGLYQEYEMTIYPGLLDQNAVQAKVTVGDMTYVLPVKVDKGLLTVRGTTNNEVTSGVGNDEDAVVNNTEAVNNSTQSTITAVTPAGTKYHINDSMVSVDPANVHLLADELALDGDDTEAAKDLLKGYITDNQIASADDNYAYQYLDLVDTSNGNAWVTATNPVDVYWKVPAGVDADSDFKVVHFPELNRQYDESTADKINADDYQATVYTEDSTDHKLDVVTLSDGNAYIKFQTTSFSPFVLVWDEAESDNPGGGGWVPDNPDEEDPETPELNTEDHFSYIVGYPEDYRTGEKTDDESLWPVKPQGNITRAEVATIFYRLLTDEARTEHWTRSNDYNDVAAESWYNTPVSTLSAMGIVRGYEDGSFRPDAPITRAEFAAIAVRFFENDNVNYEEGLFTDIEGSEWFADAVAAAQEHGIVGGYPDGSFQPNKAITRAEACSIVNRTVDRIPDKDHLLPDDQMRVWPDNSNTNAWYYADMQEATSGHVYDWVLDDNDEPLYEQWTGDLPEVDWVQVEIDQEEKHGLR